MVGLGWAHCAAGLGVSESPAMASGRVRSGRTMLAGRRAPAGVVGAVAGVLVSALGLGACSGGSVESLDNTVATEAPRTSPASGVPELSEAPRAAPVSEAPQVSGTAAATTTQPPPNKPSVALAPSTTAVPRELPSVEDLEAVSRAALAAHDEFQRQLHAGVADRARLLAVMTPSYADDVVAFLQDLRARNRRFARGTVYERKAIRISVTSDPSVLQVLICFRNNDSEFDTKGTESVDDDALIQDRLEVVGYRRQLRRVDGRWKQEGVWPEAGLCTGF